MKIKLKKNSRTFFLMKLFKNLFEIIKKKWVVNRPSSVIDKTLSVREVQSECMTWVSKNEDIKDYYFDFDNSSLFTIELD
jgi:hypothetical protein